MSETESSEDTPREKQEARKSSKIGNLVAVALVGSAAAAAGTFGGRLMHGAEPQAKAAEAAAEASDAPPTASVALPQVIVDVRDKTGDVHHLKVGISVETGTVSEEEFTKLLPRGREAAVEYLRGLDFDTATDPKSFEKIRKELGDKLKDALGKDRVKRVVITDFVGQ
jgi:flagellar basal body-associated protein FliL